MSKHILVVDDGSDVHNLPLRVLKENGFDAVGTSMAAESGRRCKPCRPTVILLDAGLPG